LPRSVLRSTAPAALDPSADTPLYAAVAHDLAASVTTATRSSKWVADTKERASPRNVPWTKPFIRSQRKCRLFGTDASRVNAAVLAPNVLSVKHWGRLLGGLLYAASPRVDWATLLRRSFEVDVLRCPSCGGRMRVLGEITGSSLVSPILESLAISTDAPRAARARDPTELLGLDDSAL
jgi:hypothetical protein